jgi:hypothetical protein
MVRKWIQFNNIHNVDLVFVAIVTSPSSDHL